MVKKGSLQTFRPLECADFLSKSRQVVVINEGLYCHVIGDLLNESTNSAFSTQTFKLVCEPETRIFSIQDFAGSEIGFNDGASPIGAVVLTGKGEFAGVLDFADGFLTPVFLPDSSMIVNIQNGDPAFPSKGENFANVELDAGNEVLGCEISLDSRVSPHGSSHANNNESLLSSEGFKPGIESSNPAKVDALDSGQREEVIQPDQECIDIFASVGKKTELETGIISNPLDRDESEFLDTLVEESSKVKDLDESKSLSLVEKSSSGTEETKGAEDVTAETGGIVISCHGKEIITRDNDNLVTVIQVGSAMSVEKGATQHEDTLGKDITESDYFIPETSPSEMSPPESKGFYNGELSDVKEPRADCSLESKKSSLIDQENFETSDPNEHVYIESNHVSLEGSLPLDTKVETESVEKQDMETSDTVLDTREKEDSIVSSESKTDMHTSDRCELSTEVIAPVDHVGNKARESGHLKECEAEDINQENSSIEPSLQASELREETDVEDIKGAQLEVSVGDEHSENAGTDSGYLNASTTLQESDLHSNTVVVDSYHHEQSEIENEKYSLRLNGNQAVITQKDFVSVTGEAVVSTGKEECAHGNDKHELLKEAMSIKESPEDIRETEVDQHALEETLSSNAIAMEKKTEGQGVQVVLQPSTNSDQREGDDNDESVECSQGETVVVQRVDADSLLTETITNNPLILDDLGKCLDTEYLYGKVPCWRDLAELLGIPPEAYEHCGTFSATSPTEDLFVFLTATKPQLTIEDIKEALKEIDRHDVAQYLDRKISAGLISRESVVASLVEKDDTGILGHMALKLDLRRRKDWKGLALQLNVPHRVLRNFGSHQKHNSSLMLLKYIPIFDPEMTLAHLKNCLMSIGRQDVVVIFDKGGIPGDEPVKNILDDSDLLDQITDLLNEDPPSPHWRHLAKELKIPQEKCKIFEPTEDVNSPSKLLFKSIERCEPDLTFEELVLALVAMKRQDVLDVLLTYFSSDDIDQILEENNLLEPLGDIPEETES
ncbi:uncharacterized protein LOC111339463 [Stylophora pistillata]|uniref:uncharacterized protein LOC111339463 n=1 Tax=Stylophora pistillata TaxID=50429 RepID=UPI000C047E84|nr:uncharacterized protein LOC111339463 [Stylophora pistillata]